MAKFSGNGSQNNRIFFILVTDPSTGLQLEVLYPFAILASIFELHPTDLGDSGETFLADGEGYFVTPARYPATQGHDHPISARPMQLCLSGKSSEVLDLDYRGTPIIHGFRFIPEFGSACIMAHIDQAEAFAPVGTLTRQLVMAIGSFILLVVLTTLHMAKSVAKPILNLTNELSKNANQLQLLLDSVAEAIYGMDMHGNCTFCNPSCLQLLGYKHAGELIGKNMHGLIHHKYPDGTFFPVEKCRIFRAFQRGEKTHVEDEVFWRADGSSFPVEYWSYPQFSEGAVAGAVVTFIDITERKQLLEELRLRAQLLDCATDSIFLHDFGGNFVYLNEAAWKSRGYTQGEMMGINLHVLDTPECEKFIETRIRELMENGSSIFESAHYRKDGSIMPIEVSARLIETGGRKLVFSASRDITERKLDHEKLLKLSRAVENSPASVVITGLNGAIEYVNKRFTTVTGYSPQEAIGQNPRILNAGIQPKEFYKEMWRTILAGKEWQGEIVNKKKNGETYLEQASISPIRDDQGNIAYFVAVKEDITERKRIMEELQKTERDNALLAAHQEGEARLRAIIDTALNAVVQMDVGGVITGWNSQAEKIFGWTRAEALGRMLHETIIPPPHREAHVQGLKRFLACGEGPLLNSLVEMTALHRDGHEFPVELYITSINTTDRCEFNAFIQDITQRRESENLIWKQANYDTLTGLPNRTLFHDRLDQEIKKAHRADLKMALLFIDLDRFKEVNDTLGHSMGDLLLVEAAHRIGGCVREADTVARLGGDEFVVILSELDDASSIERVAENILHKLSEPFHLDGQVAYVSASMGITLYPDDATGMEDLLKDADQAMYAAKNAGRNRLSYFTPALQQAAQTRLHLLNDLRGALAGDQFRVYYQPIVELATGRIHKAEALIRWQHPARGMVSPAQFIPLAEDSGLIVEIGDWVFRKAARQAKRWRTLHDAGFQISANVSPVQFHSADGLCKIWLAYLQELGLSGQSIVIEITEGLLLNTESGVIDKLLKFHNVGIQISLDDFGTGYSSLSYLKKFDIDYLKIDQSFVRNLADDPNDMALSEAIIVMAHKLGLKVIAEGVETEEQRKLLAAAGCDYAQGYLFSRPVPAREFEALLVHGDK